MIKVTSKVKIHEIDDKDVGSADMSEILVLSHWSSARQVAIQLPDGKRYTVAASDLIAAIKNAINTNRF